MAGGGAQQESLIPSVNPYVIAKADVVGREWKCPQTSNEGMKINARKYKIMIQFLNVWYPMLPECSYLDSMNIIQ